MLRAVALPLQRQQKLRQHTEPLCPVLTHPMKAETAETRQATAPGTAPPPAVMAVRTLHASCCATLPADHNMTAAC